jgi:hypothetical protein
MNSIGNTMKNVNTTGLMLGMLAVGGLIAGGALMTGQAYAQPINAATASNSDDDTVNQSNSASVTQKAKVKCKASVSDDDGVQVGSNTNTAANACYSDQSATIGQANVNTDNDVQVASAEACQAIAGLIGANVCGNAF